MGKWSTEYAVSLWGRYSFAWANPLITQSANQKKPLDPDDFATLRYAVRSNTLNSSFERVRGSGNLWKTLFLAHRGPIFLQTSLTIVSSVFSILPQLALYGILQSLEKRKSENCNDPLQSGLQVLRLGGVTLLTSLLEVWLLWIIYSRVGIPIYEQLCGVLFQAAMRGHDVRRSAPSDPENDKTDQLLAGSRLHKAQGSHNNPNSTWTPGTACQLHC